MIRAVPSNASDNVYSTLLAQSAVHGAMAGYTGFTVGPVHGRECYLPFYVNLTYNYSPKTNFIVQKKKPPGQLIYFFAENNRKAKQGCDNG